MRVDRFGLLPILAALSLVFPVPLRAGEDTAQVHFFHALKAREEGRLLEAESLFRKAVELEPGNPNYRFELGNLYLLRGRPQAARLEFEQAAMAAPGHVPSHFNLGLVYRELEMTSEARNEFRRVLELDPQNLKAQIQIGYTYAQEGFTEEARDAFRKAEEMDPTSPEPKDALNDLGRLESQARARSEADRSRRFSENQRSLYEESDPLRSSEVSGEQALAQAGAALIQELFARRAQAREEAAAE